MSKKTATYHQFTKSEIETVFKLWKTKTKTEIAKSIGVSETQINYIATQMRKSGINLPKKHKNGYLRTLIEEVKRDLKI